MNNDLKIIKKHYGEKFMHLCRELFATILDNSPGILPQLLLDNFYPSHYLYEDLTNEDCLADFKTYLYSRYDLMTARHTHEKHQVPSPSELLHQAGYTLYECKNEEDIQKFKKYYRKGEELCTFNGQRLNYCHVYFAVKDDADKLNRQDFTNPRRQDAYGISVISIQFTKDDFHTLSIKNRYNHTVANPDATYNNNLDNIFPGLTQSFADYYGMTSTQSNKYTLEIPGYVQDNTGKFYKYNYEINNVYYCPNNIVIDYFRATQYDKEKYLIADYFIIDLVNKTIYCKLDVADCFPETIGNIKNIQITKNDEEKTVTIIPEVGEDIIIVLDKYNRIIRLKNNNVETINDDFLTYNKVLQDISLDKVTSIGMYFLCNNEELTKLSLPNVIDISHIFLPHAQLTEINLPKVKIIGGQFLEWNVSIKEISLPKVKEIGSDFLGENEQITKVDLPEVEFIGYGFLSGNKSLKIISLPCVKEIGGSFLDMNQKITTVDLPNVEIIGSRFLMENTNLIELNLPKVVSIGDMTLNKNLKISQIILPNVKQIGLNFLLRNLNVHVFYAPKLETSLQNDYLRPIWTRSSKKIRQLKK